MLREARAPAPGRELSLSVAGAAVAVSRPPAGELPLADVDFAPLLRALDAGVLCRALLLLLTAEPSLLVIADDATQLFPAITALLALLYPPHPTPHPLPRTKWTRRVSHPVLIGHAPSRARLQPLPPHSSGGSSTGGWL